MDENPKKASETLRKGSKTGQNARLGLGANACTRASCIQKKKKSKESTTTNEGGEEKKRERRGPWIKELRKGKENNQELRHRAKTKKTGTAISGARDT